MVPLREGYVFEMRQVGASTKALCLSVSPDPTHDSDIECHLSLKNGLLLQRTYCGYDVER